MMDLQTRLQQLGGPIEAASAETVGADMVRGRRAVRRRRVAQTAAGSAFGVAALAAAFAFGTPTTGTPDTSRPPAVAQSRLELVDYRGPQPKHFVVDKVPEGYFIQNDYYGGLVIAPNRVKNPGPDVDPSKDPMYDPQHMTGKIAIYLESKAYRGSLDGEKLTVGGREAVLHPITGEDAWQLIMSVSPDVYATVQVDVPLSQEQIVELGAGLHIDKAAIDRAAAPLPGK